jgi:glycosyltransferase involved in cell wall biosynthesis
VRELRANGHHVDVLSPQPSAAHHHLDLASSRGPLALAKRVRDYDEVIIQFHPDVFLGRAVTDRERMRQLSGLLACFTAAHRVDVRLHEFKHDPPAARTVEGQLWRRLWRAADRITVHTETERTLFASAYGIDAARVEVIDHGAHFARRYRGSRSDARALLGLSEDGFHAVSIGFLQPHKGFDRAVDAFVASGLAERGAHLHIVGSVRTSEPHFMGWADQLEARCAQTPGVTMHRGFVSDQRFDAWLAAADAVVLPYRMIWSSGVMERARLFDVPVIATRVGGVADQAPPGTVLVADDHDLATALSAAADTAGLPPLVLTDRTPTPWGLNALASAADIQTEITRRSR